MSRILARTFAGAMQSWRGWNYSAPLRELESLERADEATLQEYRANRLRDLLVYCEAHVPFYADAFREAGLDPRDVHGAPELSHLPLVDKDLLREDYSRFRAAPGGRPYDQWSSSGSTGQPFAFRLDRASTTRNTFASLARGRRWWGIDVGVPEVMIWSGIRDVSDTWLGKYRALGRRLSWRMKNVVVVDTYDLDEAKVRAAYDRLLRFRPESSRSISSGLYRFASLAEKLGLDGRALGIRHAIYTGEAFPAAQRIEVERILGCKTICEYGCTELGVLAFECPEGGLHLMHENFFFEYLKDGKPAQPGEQAELVVTNLNDYVSPLVRYAVGDVVVPTERKCVCGRSMPLIDSLGGRAHAAIHTPGGGVVHGLFFTHLFDELPVVHRFRVIQRRLDMLRIELTSSVSIGPEVIGSVASRVGQVMGEGVALEVEQVDDLPLAASGKFRWIVSEVDGPATQVD